MNKNNLQIGNNKIFSSTNKCYVAVKLPSWHWCYSAMKLIVIVILMLLFALQSNIYAEDDFVRKGTYDGYLQPTDRYNYDLHDLRTGDIVRIDLKNVTGNLDPFLRVSHGDFVVENDDSGMGSDALIEFIAPREGTYDIEILPFKDETFGEYLLIVEVSSDEPYVKDGPVATLNLEKSYVSLAVQELVSSFRLGELHKYDLAQLNSDYILYIYAEPLTEGLELKVQIRDFQNKVISEALPSSTSNITKVKFNITETSGRYSLVVKPKYELTAGDYRVILGINSSGVMEGEGRERGEPVIREPMEINVGFELNQVTNVNQRDENYGVVGIFRAEWVDRSLAFDASDHEATVISYADRQFIGWLELNSVDWPDFRIVNLQTKEIQHRILNIHSDGRVFFEEHLAATLQAPEFDFRKFPFDKQDLWLRIQTRMPNTSVVLGIHENPNFNRIGTQLGEEEWVIFKSDANITNESGYSRFNLDMKASRNTTYYIYRLLLPIGLILIIGWALFLIFDHNTQIAAASGNLLVFIAFNFTVADDLPRLGYLTFLDSLLIIGFMTSAVTLMLAFYLKRIEDKGIKDHWAIEKKIVLILPLVFLLMTALLIMYFFMIN